MRKPAHSTPVIERLDPQSALPGAEVRLLGRGLADRGARPSVRVGGTEASLAFAAPEIVVARLAENAVTGPVELEPGNGAKPLAAATPLTVATQIADNLHPVCNPAVDAEGNVYATLSGARGQKTPVSIFKIDPQGNAKAWSSAITNPSGLAFDAAGALHASSRHAGAVYRLTPNGSATQVAEGLGVATGIAFDAAGDLYVGDRSGTIFKIDRNRSTFVFATLEPSVAAYHLAFGPDHYLYVAGPTISSYDTVWRISPTGAVEAFFRGLGRPQGLAFEADGCLLAVGSWRGRMGVTRITPAGGAECALAGANLVGLALADGAAGPSLYLASRTAVFHLPWAKPGLPLPARES